MSYILDALRKSDRERQRGAAPTLLAAQATAVAPRQPALLSYGLLALVLVGAGVAIGWLRPWQPAEAPRALRLAAKPPEPATSPAVPPERSPKSEPEARLPGTTASAAPAVPPAPRPIPTQTRASAAHTTESAAAAKPGALHPPATEPSSKAVEPVSKQRVNTGPAAVAPVPSAMSMAELPLAIQQELPAMSITVHAYSAKPTERLVGINNHLLREGDEVAPGLALERITPDGMILNYKGYSFRRGVH